MDVKPLLDLATTHIAHLIVEARTPEGIRKRFNIKNDLTPEDLKKVGAVCDRFVIFHTRHKSCTKTVNILCNKTALKIRYKVGYIHYMMLFIVDNCLLTLLIHV